MINRLLNDPYLDDRFIDRRIMNPKGQPVIIIVSEFITENLLDHLKHFSVINAKFYAGPDQVVSHPRELVHSLTDSIENKALYWIHRNFMHNGIAAPGVLGMLPLKESSFNQRSLTEKLKLCYLPFEYTDRNVGTLIEYLVDNP